MCIIDYHPTSQVRVSIVFAITICRKLKVWIWSNLHDIMSMPNLIKYGNIIRSIVGNDIIMFHLTRFSICHITFANCRKLKYDFGIASSGILLLPNGIKIHSAMLSLYVYRLDHHLTLQISAPISLVVLIVESWKLSNLQWNNLYTKCYETR